MHATGNDRRGPGVGGDGTFIDTTYRHQETFMTPTAIRLATLAIAACVAFSPALVRAAGTDTPNPPPPSDSDKSKSKNQKKSFLDGYKRAYAAIYQRHDYAAG